MKGILYMKTKLTELNGIGMTYERKLSFAGIDSIEQLIHKCSDEQKLQKVSKVSGIPINIVNRWATSAELLSIDRVTPNMVTLFHEAGITNITQLSRANPRRLAKKMFFINELEGFLPKSPMIKDVRDMVLHAQAIAQNRIN